MRGSVGQLRQQLANFAQPFGRGFLPGLGPFHLVAAESAVRRAVDGLRRPEALEKPIEGADAGGMALFKATEDGIQGTALQLLHPLGNRPLAHFEHQQEIIFVDAIGSRGDVYK